jgi:hypothetical protein
MRPRSLSISSSRTTSLTTTRWLLSTFALLAAALFTGFGIVLLGLHVATRPGFSGLLTTPYGQVQDYAFSLQHEDCEILIYGDSSTMTGDDPALIETQTHLKTCNISQTQPTVLVTGMLPVELYLRHNKLPRFLVIQLAPEAFFQSHAMDQTAAFDPIMLMVRHGAGWATVRKLLTYPVQTLQYVSLVLQDRYRPNTRMAAAFATTYDRSIADYATNRGLLTLPKPLEIACGPLKSLGKADFGWIDDAKRRYSALGVNVLIRVSPIPDCDGEIGIYKQALTSHLDGETLTLPLALYNDSDRHFTVEGARLVSAELAAKIVSMKR